MSIDRASASPVIRCARVTLRRLALADAPAIAAYRSDPDVARYQSWDTCSLADAETLCRRQLAAEFGAPGTWFQLAIARNADDVVIGDCGLHFVAKDELEIGFTLGASNQGKGYATEAIAGVLDLAFGSLGKHRVTARVDTRNDGAIRLMDRLGFRREGAPERAMFKGAWCEEIILVRTSQGRPSG